MPDSVKRGAFCVGVCAGKDSGTGMGLSAVRSAREVKSVR